MSQGRQVSRAALTEALYWAKMHAYAERRVLFADMGDFFLVGALDDPQRQERTPALALLYILAVEYSGAWVDITDCAGGSPTCSATRQRMNTCLATLGTVSPVLAAEFGNIERIQLRTDNGKLLGRYQRAATSPEIVDHVPVLNGA